MQKKPGDAPGCGRLVWHGDEAGTGHISLSVVDKKRLDQGAEVSWVVAGELLDISVQADTQALNTLADVPGLISFHGPRAQNKNFAPKIGLAYSPGRSGRTRG